MPQAPQMFARVARLPSLAAAHTACHRLPSPAMARTACRRLSIRSSSSGGVPGLVDCSRVRVFTDAHGGAGAFAAIDIAKGSLVERGIVRVLTNVDGHENPYVFTWSDKGPENTTWAVGSGASTFYNTSISGNTLMERDFDNNSFTITATQDIKAGDELVHVYKSKAWRRCFMEL